MPESGRRRSRGKSGAVRKTEFAAGVLLSAALLGFIDVLHARVRMPEPPGLGVFVLAWLVSTGGLAMVCAPLLLANRVIWQKTPRRLRALVGAIDGLLLGSMALLLENNPSIRPEHRYLATIVVIAGSAVTAALAERFARPLRVLGALVACLLVAWIESQSSYGKPWLRLSVDLVVLGAAATAWEGFRLRAAAPRAVLGTFVALTILAPLGVFLVPALRGAVFEYGT